VSSRFYHSLFRCRWVTCCCVSISNSIYCSWSFHPCIILCSDVVVVPFLHPNHGDLSHPSLISVIIFCFCAFDSLFSLFFFFFVFFFLFFFFFFFRVFRMCFFSFFSLVFFYKNSLSVFLRLKLHFDIAKSDQKTKTGRFFVSNLQLKLIKKKTGRFETP